jgi:hypothetical protein
MEQREEQFKKELVEELRRVITFVRNEPDFERKIYFFSAAYGIMGRTFRYAFSKDVLLADFVLTTTYNLLQDRLMRLKAGDPTVAFDRIWLDRICDELDNLATKFEANETIFEPLQNIMTIGYSTTGTGNYLRQKGDLKL